MQHLSTAFLIIALVIVVNEGGGVRGEDDALSKTDLVAEETKNNAMTLIEGPKYVAKPETTPTPAPIRASGQNQKPEQRPPSKPPIYPEKSAHHKYYVEITRPYYGTMQKLPPRPQFSQPIKLFNSPNSVYSYQKVIPLPHHKNQYYIKQQPRPILYSTPTNKTAVAKPKFSLPVQVIKGIRADHVKPPHRYNATTVTTTAATTTTKYLRTKRIWPKKMLEKMNATTTFNSNRTTTNSSVANAEVSDHDPSASITRIRYVFKNSSLPTLPPTRRPYRPVTRIPKIRPTTLAANDSDFENNDWVPIVPSHYTKVRRPLHSRTRRSAFTPETSALSKRTLYLHSFGLVPMQNVQSPQTTTPETQQTPELTRKNLDQYKNKRHLNHYYSRYSLKPGGGPYYYGDLQAEGSHSHVQHPRVVTKVKHHHHHHHHRYVKTVEKQVKVPVQVMVPKPYPVAVEKKVHVPVEKIKIVEKPVPYAVTVEKKVPYPVGIKVPHPVPYKVIEKEYVPKPYPVVQQVPVLKHVQVRVPQPYPVTVEKRVPVPVEVRVPVDRPVPVPVTVEKQVPYPVPVKVFVPQPYPVETKVPYPVHVKVKEPVEVIKHVPVKVPFPQPFAVKVPHPVQVTVEKRVPYPVEVEKKVPVPVEILVPHPVEVEKKVPIYVPKPYPVEKKVPYPIKVPYPVKVPVRVPIEVPIYIHGGPTGYSDEDYGGGVSDIPDVTASPHHTVTVHGSTGYVGSTGFAGFHSRSDNENASESQQVAVTTPLTPTS